MRSSGYLRKSKILLFNVAFFLRVFAVLFAEMDLFFVGKVELLPSLFNFFLVHLSSFVIICHHLSSCVIMCHHVSSCVIMCHHVSSCVIMCHHVSSCVIICHHLSSFVIICHHLSSFVIICHHLSSFVIICNHLSSFVTLQRSRVQVASFQCQHHRDGCGCIPGISMTSVTSTSVTLEQAEAVPKQGYLFT